MPSSYTSSLRLTLPVTGELSGAWGNTVNTGITELVDASIAGTTTISTWGGTGVAYTLTNNNGSTDEARRMVIRATGSPGEAKDVICPAVSKLYVFRNDTTGGFALTLKTAAGAGIAVAAGQSKLLYCNGTDVVDTFNAAGTLNLSGLGVAYTANPPIDNGNGINALRVITSAALAADTGGAVSLGGVATTTGSQVAFGQIAGRKDNATTADYAGYIQFCTNTTSGTMIERVRITSGGDFALGGIVATPSGLGGRSFTVNTTGTNYGGVELSRDGNYVGALRIKDAGADNNLVLINNTANALVFGTSNTERARIDSSGNLGVGTSSPAATAGVTLSKTSNVAYEALLPSVASIAFGYNNSGSANAWGAPTGAGFFGTPQAVPLTFVTNAVERARITSGGDFIPIVQTAAPALSTNQQMVFTLTSNTNLRVSVRGTDGVTRVTDLTLV